MAGRRDRLGGRGRRGGDRGGTGRGADGYVSLRGTASDSDGNAVTVTVIGAYGYGAQA